MTLLFFILAAFNTTMAVEYGDTCASDSDPYVEIRELIGDEQAKNDFINNIRQKTYYLDRQQHNINNSELWRELRNTGFSYYLDSEKIIIGPNTMNAPDFSQIDGRDLLTRNPNDAYVMDISRGSGTGAKKKTDTLPIGSLYKKDNVYIFRYNINSKGQTMDPDLDAYGRRQP